MCTFSCFEDVPQKNSQKIENPHQETLEGHNSTSVWVKVQILNDKQFCERLLGTLNHPLQLCEPIPTTTENNKAAVSALSSCLCSTGCWNTLRLIQRNIGSYRRDNNESVYV